MSRFLPLTVLQSAESDKLMSAIERSDSLQNGAGIEKPDDRVIGQTSAGTELPEGRPKVLRTKIIPPRQTDGSAVPRRNLFTAVLRPVKETITAVTTPHPEFLNETTDRRTFLGDLGRTAVAIASVNTIFWTGEARSALFTLPPPSHEVLPTPLTDTDKAYNAMLASYSIDDGLFNRIGRHEAPNGQPLRWEATLWPTTNAYNAMMSYNTVLELRGSSAPTGLQMAHHNLYQTNIGIERFWDRDYEPHSYDSVVKPKRPGDMIKTLFRTPERYNDDTAWVIHAHTRAVRGRSEEERQQGIFNQSTSRVEDALVQLFEDLNRQKDVGIPQKRPIPGEKSDSRNIVSNAPVILAALRYRELLPDDQEHGAQRLYYLAQSQKIYDSMHSALYAPRDGLYYDNTSRTEGTDTRIFSYCQGAMIGAGVLLADATGDPLYLQQAEVTARSSLLHYRKIHVDMLHEPLAFVEIYLRNLLYLASVTNDQELARDIERTVTVEAKRIKDSPKFYDPNTSHMNLTNPAYKSEQHLTVQAGLVGLFALDELVRLDRPRSEKYGLLI